MNRCSNKKFIINVLLLVAIFITFITFAAFKICFHQDTQQLIVVEPKCTTQGLMQVRCVECDKLMEESIVDEIGHNMTEYIITQQPGPNTNGTQTRTCTQCSFVQSIEYICPHNNYYMELIQPPTCAQEGIWNIKCSDCETIINTTNVVVLPHVETYVETTQEPTCQTEGIETEFCAICASIIKETPIDLIDHDYGDWNYSKWATPTESGYRTKYCTMCNDAHGESYTMSMPSSNSIYIPGTGICGSVSVCALTQSNVDAYDMVCDWGYFTHNGPMILGHNYGSLRNLHKTKVGQYIYVSIGGNITTYKVFISEYALQNDSHTNIIGQSSGVDLWTNNSSNILKMYTCYGGGEGRWLVFAEKI